MIAGTLYYKDRNMMTMLELYIRDRLPVSESMIKLSFLLMAASLPILELYNLCQRILGIKKKDKLEIDDPDMQNFIEEYYPETLENVEKATVVLDTIAEIDGFLERISKIFDKNLDPLECQRVIALARYARKDIESNCKANVTYEGHKVPLIFKISRVDDADENFKIDVFTKSDVMDKIDEVMNDYIKEIETKKEA